MTAPMNILHASGIINGMTFTCAYAPSALPDRLQMGLLAGVVNDMPAAGKDSFFL